MPQSDEISQALRIWAEVFTRQSMKGLLAYVRNLDLSMTQVNVLLHLFYKDNCSVSDLAGKLGFSNAAASQLVKRLEQGNLIQRHEGKTDRRIRKIELTNDGRSIAEALIETRFAWLSDLAASFTSEQTHRISLALEELTDAALRKEKILADKIAENPISKD
jgi:DNA-binding MarR family transcriptional regulator